MLRAAETTSNSSFQEKLAAAREHRSSSVARAAHRVERLSDIYKLLNEDLDRRISFFNDPGRLRSSSRLFAERRPAANKEFTLLASGESWSLPPFTVTRGLRFRHTDIADKSLRRVLSRAPTKRDLHAFFQADEICWVHAGLQAMKILSRQEALIRDIAGEVSKAVSGIPEALLGDAPRYIPRPAPPFISLVERSVYQQDQITMATVSRIFAANGALDVLENRLDEACMKFNSIITKHRRRGKLLCYWEVNKPVQIDTCRTIKGPTFYTLSLGKHTLTRVRTGGDDSKHPQKNTVTKQLLKQCYLMRYADSYLEQAANIESLREERKLLVSALQAVIRVLRPIDRIKQETSL